MTAMKTRTTEKTVTFTRPFALAGLGEFLPAGDYSVETEKKLIEGSSVAAYRRTATLLSLRKRSGPFHLTRANLTQPVAVDPVELKAALKLDAKSAIGSAAPGDRKAKPPGAAPPRQEETDRRALDRAEDEGMIVGPL